MASRTTLLAGAAGSALLLAASSAFAADVIAVPPPPLTPPPALAAPIPGSLFSGPYIGAIFGVGTGQAAWDNTPYGPWETTEHRLSGILAGVEAGFRFQPGGGPLVVGIEGDWAWTNIDGADDCGPLDAYTCTTNLNWLATLTGQVGIAPGGGNLLLYGEAGFAWANQDFTVEGDGVALTGDRRNSGWLVGGGAVLAMDNGLYLKAEYNYINFGTETAIGMTGDGGAAEFDLTQHAHVFKVGVGLQF
ncbi:MAG: outer membrane protein [Bauldia sp.]